jgi:hypothetical protein
MPTLTRDDLLNYIFDGQKTELYQEFEVWLRGSRRFAAFAATYRGKIRAKLKNARHDGGLQDVRAELLAAARLLCEERFTLEYERYAAAKQRGPDFTVTFKTHTPFNVEVRRVRGGELEETERDARVNKLILVIMDKARQMPPGIINLLWLVGERTILEEDLNRTVTALRQAVEGKDDDFFTRRGFAVTGDFLRQYRQLSGIVVAHPDRHSVWLNSFARHKIPAEIKTAIERLAAA